MNKGADNGHPCLILVVKAKYFDVVPLFKTQLSSLLYRMETYSLNLGPKLSELSL